ncbi:MAG: acetylxylan esterase [Chloroflexota bacterium]
MAVDTASFEGYWAQVDAELAELGAAPELEPMPGVSNEHCTVSRVRLTSIGPYRIFGYLSVPTAEGQHPGLLLTPRYGSVNHIPDYNDRARYVVLQIMHRGQRLADTPYAAAYPGLLTDGIDDPERYVYRGIVADCLRAAELLLAQPRLDLTRVAVQGDDLAIITAARRQSFSCVLPEELLFYRLREIYPRTDAYPAEEINDFLRASPDSRAAVDSTLSLFDPVHHASRVLAKALVSAPDGAAADEWVQPLERALGGLTERFTVTHYSGTDNDAKDAWLAGQLDVPAMSRFRQ